MKGRRFAAMIAGIIVAVCLLYTIVTAIVAVVIQPMRMTPISIDINIMIAIAAAGIVAFVLFLILRSRSERE